MWKGSIFNVHVEWENGEITNKIADDPVTYAIYAKDNNLLDVPGWNTSNPLPDASTHVLHGQPSQAQVLPSSPKIQV
jgi:hypothetical protein